MKAMGWMSIMNICMGMCEVISGILKITAAQKKFTTRLGYIEDLKKGIHSMVDDIIACAETLDKSK